MNIQFDTLENESLSRLAAVFNAAFAQYFVPISMTEELLAAKFRADNALLSLSVGAYHNNELVGFIFHGYGEKNNEKQVYNCGTGVLPGYRGHQLAEKMYAFILPLLQQQQIQHSVLEVITENERAIKVYERRGFKKLRKVNCYRGQVQLTSPTGNWLIKEATTADPAWLNSMIDHEPTWQNSFATLERLQGQLVYLVATEGNEHTGCIAMNPSTGKLFFLGVNVAMRRRGLGSALLLAAAARNNNIVM
ncbi:MAG: GNAT family N-acetyltransferase, partial [Dinghuibacter sp.]|nr:GNAT family N-acetyltransferase [Dinghuibacter sp.]